MTDQSVPQPPQAPPQPDPASAWQAGLPAAQSNLQAGLEPPPPTAPTQPAPPIAETHTTVTLDGVEQTIGEALTLLGTRNSLVQQVEAYIQTYGRDAGDWLHRIVDAVIGALPSS